MESQQFTLGPGFKVAITHDACGCTICFHIARFKGLEKALDPMGNQTVRYLEGGLGPIVQHTTHVKIPGERGDRLSSDTILEWYDIPGASFEDWLQERLLRFHLMGAPDAVEGDAEWASALKRVGVDTADIMDAIDLADVQAAHEPDLATILGSGYAVRLQRVGGPLVVVTRG